MEDLQQEKRNRSQNAMDAKVHAANAADTVQELQSRREIVARQNQKCNCHPVPRGNPRYVLQPTTVPAHNLRPGGNIGDWLTDLGERIQETAKNIVDPAVDAAAQTAGQAACEFLDYIGATDDIEPLLNSFDEALGHRQGHNKAWTVMVDMTIGGAPYLIETLLRTCDLGPALKDYAAIEARRMGVAKVTFQIMGIGAAASIVGLPAAAVCVKGAALAAAMQMFYLTVAQGRWISWEQVALILSSVKEFMEVAELGNQTELDEGITDVLETAQTVKQAEDEASGIIDSLAQTTEQLQMMEREFAGVGEFARSGSIDPQNVAIQPSPFNPQLSVFPTFAPNPLIVRPTIVTPPTAPPAYYEVDTPPPEKKGGLTFPLIGLGLLLEVL
ncbi:MAG: hypothetical protein GY915_00955 [bacterium]|nr:hypothetical protein [bacterium]